jgi:hypothetical protein
MMGGVLRIELRQQLAATLESMRQYRTQLRRPPSRR